MDYPFQYRLLVQPGTTNPPLILERPTKERPTGTCKDLLSRGVSRLNLKRCRSRMNIQDLPTSSKNKPPSILNKSFLITILIWIAVTETSFQVEAQNLRHLEPSDLFGIQRVGAPVLSPEAEWIAYTLTETSLEQENSETRVWMVSTNGGNALPMTVSGTSSGNPQWSPDGKFLSFSSKKDLFSFFSNIFNKSLHSFSESLFNTLRIFKETQRSFPSFALNLFS